MTVRLSLAAARSADTPPQRHTTAPRRRHGTTTSTPAPIPLGLVTVRHSRTQRLDWHARWCRLGDQVHTVGEWAAVAALALTASGLVCLLVLALLHVTTL